ncbi:MAG: superoxide dismutase [Candidatus Thermoplasmatota archaeon]|jgi:Fe-Mn family superoxide dismutase|nr:superoxide dismutase [Candidatus Thermoplasmatota archaeon]MCL5681309.1 superoxide dismutase [Candidatus Thermoplasmatota archaeon]
MGNYSAKLPSYKSLKGISERMLAEHLKLYNGYINKSNEIVDKLGSGTVDLSKSAATYSEFRALKLEQTFNGNGMYLHQYYFENLTEATSHIPDTVGAEITKNFGGFDKWKEEFVATGMAGRGWTVLGLNLEDGKLYNLLYDAHNIGGFVSLVPLLVLDVFEHAYFIDYGTNRKEYINAYLGLINWNVVEKRLEKAKKMHKVWTE